MKSLRTAKLALKRGTEGKGSKQLSPGFELARFQRAEDAVKAVMVAQNSVLEGLVLRPQVTKHSNRHGAGELGRSKKSDFKAKPRSNWLAQNISFETTSAEVRQVFSSFG